jgi:predicted membrane-bound mannosyltransferase
MQAQAENVRAGVPMRILWKWTSVSALLHGLLIAALCGVSYLGFQKREAVAKAKAQTEDAAAKAREAEEAAKVAKDAATAPVAATNPGDPKPAPPQPQPAQDPAKTQAQAEKILGIDKVAKPDEIPKSPFATKGDDLLKDLK